MHLPSYGRDHLLPFYHQFSSSSFLFSFYNDAGLFSFSFTWTQTHTHASMYTENTVFTIFPTCIDRQPSPLAIMGIIVHLTEHSYSFLPPTYVGSTLLLSLSREKNVWNKKIPCISGLIIGIFFCFPSRLYFLFSRLKHSFYFIIVKRLFYFLFETFSMFQL